ncbi:pericentriolar material 1 protein [Cinnamomum micranthum f. kanehirae]|uniref:Pericentriolar material 1 protein n=1 Tax=Cinnamomum micranthum f. kanehirae TaxID=337451 RepID=A0A3S3MQA9_9MAGN|nr:pericentriolar material 1 protein [Cinnamomum micranthum f. kanehirae]
MDVWIVAAAAGAGYLAKYWQNVLKEREALSEPPLGNSINEKSRSDLSMGNQPVYPDWMEPRMSGGSEQSCFSAKRIQRHSGEEASSNGEDIPLNLVERHTDTLCLDAPSSLAIEIASTSWTDGVPLPDSVKDEESNAFSFSTSRPPFFSSNNEQDGYIINDKYGYEPNDQPYLLQPHIYPRKTGTGYDFRRDRSSLNCKWSLGHSVKPRNSLESCLIAQLYKENIEVEEYVYSSLPLPPAPILRPLIITDGNQVISKASYVSLSGRFESGQHMLHTENGENSRGQETADGVLPLPHVGLIELPRKPIGGKINIRHTRRSRKHSQSQGLPEGMLLFCLGISIGVMSTILARKREVDELNDLLKQTQNLVQDLHEELEMRDSVTMKELANEACIFQEINCPNIKESMDSFPCQSPTGSSTGQVEDESTLLDDKKANGQEESEKLELMSKIEAELEAELERLELNINTSSPERRLSDDSDLDELDPDLIAEVVRGELRPDLINGGAPDSDHDSGGSSTNHTHPANYAVSPKELSLRLHQLIQSRLEERVSELELALQDSQKRLQFMEAQRDFSNSDLGSPSTQESPTRMEHADVMSSPLYLNLAGDALNAYNEAYTEFMRANEAKEEDPPSTINGCKQIDDGIHPLNQSLYCDWKGNENGSLPDFENSESMPQNGMVAKADYDYEDEIGKLLIKQIVEKTRQGSPVVLNAQRILFSMEDEQ